MEEAHMDDTSFYFHIPDSTKKEEIINGLLSSFVKAREKVNCPSNFKGFDEDVNLYISHLLFAISIPNYTSITEQYISLHDSEVKVLADMAEDQYLKYFIYKVNADNLLVHLGAFQDLSYKKHSRALNKTIDDYLKDAQEFYLAAAQLNRKIYKRRTAIADVLLKLSKNLESYIKSLAFMRKDFFLFLNRFEDQEFSSFLDSMKSYEKKIEYEGKQNLFLDLYAQWLKRKSSTLKTKINKLCIELHELDSSFVFTLE